MKKVKIILTTLVLLLALAGCQNKSTTSSEYLISGADSATILNAFNTNGIVYFYIQGSKLGDAGLKELTELSNEYKVKVYAVNLLNTNFLKSSTDTNVQAMYTKMGDKAKFLDDGITLTTPYVFEIENGEIKNTVQGISAKDLNADNLTDDNLKDIKDSYKSMFEAQSALNK